MLLKTTYVVFLGSFFSPVKFAIKKLLKLLKFGKRRILVEPLDDDDGSEITNTYTIAYTHVK